MPVHVAPAPVPISPKPKPKLNTQSNKRQAHINKSQTHPIVKFEPTPVKISPKVEVHQKPSTPIATSKRSQPAPSPVTYATPQIMIPAPSPMTQANMQSQTPKKQIQAQQNEEKRQSIQLSAEKPEKPTPAKSTKPPVDYQVLLLSLADEYLNAAHSRGTTTSLAGRESDVEEYYKLVATGLGCLEAVLKVGRCSTGKWLHPC
jgi:hypothetical protein